MFGAKETIEEGLWGAGWEGECVEGRPLMAMPQPKLSSERAQDWLYFSPKLTSNLRPNPSRVLDLLSPHVQPHHQPPPELASQHRRPPRTQPQP